MASRKFHFFAVHVYVKIIPTGLQRENKGSCEGQPSVVWAEGHLLHVFRFILESASRPATMHFSTGTALRNRVRGLNALLSFVAARSESLNPGHTVAMRHRAGVDK